MRIDRIAPLFFMLAALQAALSNAAAQGAEGDLSAFMKAKLRHSEKVLEGLATEDYELIVKTRRRSACFARMRCGPCCRPLNIGSVAASFNAASMRLRKRPAQKISKRPHFTTSTQR